MSCWGFESSTAALEQILEQIIGALEDSGIDTSSIRCMPSQYIKAITGRNAVLDWLWDFIHSRPKNPDEFLKRVEQLLIKNKKHFLLVIEDIDRNEHPYLIPL